MVPQADYREKFNAVMAGNDIPDTVLLTGDQLTMPRLPDLLDARFADLSEYLSGDAVEAYPNLANIPTYAWRGARVDGRLWGVPVEQQVLTNVMMARVDLLSSIGVAPADVKTTDDFTDLCAELTAPSSGRWAMGPFGPTMMLLFWAAFGVPNNWRQEPDGTLTKDWETDEYFAAVEYHLELSKQGYFHPDFTGYTVTQAKQAFSSGTTALYMDGLAAWRGFVEQERRSVDEIGVMLPFALPGADPVFHVASGIFGITALRQDDPAVVQDRLKLLDFLAAPFGTEEWFLLNYGVDGVDHEMTGGLPVLTDKGIEEIRTMFKFIGAPPGVMFSGQSPQWVEAQHAWESAVIPATIPDPTVGVYIEPVEDTTGALQAVYDAVADVTAERISIDDFRAITENWTEKIGNETRERLQEAMG
ncbi:extracellular solute-binding protein [Jiangella alkaliphila]|uniref:extracellular solute-binding protein n=1 Tax=Jiangella alkaliphila TaxID=419479 RepID=UPI002277359C|nr:extracellular solute-binding protein [Jiangella alkaliphila]